MKRILFLILVLFSKYGYAQHPIGNDSFALQTLGNSKTLVKSKGAISSDSGFINTHFTDTAKANLSKIKNYPGAQIRVGNDIWVRDSTATKWNILGGSGGGTNIYNSDGVLTDPVRTLTGDNNTKSLALDSLNYFRVARNGVTRIYMNSAASNLFSPNGLNNVDVYNTYSALAANSYNTYFKVFSDTSNTNHRISYTENIASTYTPFSLITKHDLDSAAVVGSGNPAKPNELLSGGIVTWQHDYVYNVSPAVYKIDYIIYSSPSTDITLAAADATDDRIDLFVLTTSNTAIAITGTPSTPPVSPDYDANSQFYLGFATVDAATTAPTTPPANLWIYQENLGSPTEWTVSVSAGTINPNSTGGPCSGSKSIEGTNVANGQYMTLTAPVAPNMSLYNAYIFQIKSKGNFQTTKKLVFQFYNGTTPIGTTVVVGSGSYGFNSTNTTNCQTLTIGLADFGNVSGATGLRMTQLNTPGTAGWYIDNIQLQAASGGTTPTGTEIDPTVDAKIKAIPVTTDATTNKYYYWNNGSIARHQIPYSDISGTPTNVSTFTNDAGYITTASSDFNSVLGYGNTSLDKYFIMQISDGGTGLGIHDMVRLGQNPTGSDFGELDLYRGASGTARAMKIYHSAIDNYSTTNNSLYRLNFPNNTATRIVDFPNASGTLALTSDIPSLSGYELLSNKATDFSTLNNTLYPTTQAVADYVTASIPDLQAVTDIGNTTTNTIQATQFTVDPGSGYTAILGTASGGGVLELKDAGSSFTAALYSNPLAGYVSLYLPSQSGTLLGSAPIFLQPAAKTANYTLTANDFIINVTANSNTYTLPTAVGRAGKMFTIKNSGGGSPVVNTTSSQTIDGSTTYTLTSQYEYVSVISDGSNWIIIDKNATGGGGGGETNTASNLGGGLANYSTKVGADLRFNSFDAADFDLASNLISIDATKWQTISGADAAYQPLDADLTYLAGFTPSANVKTILNAADYSAVRTALSLVIGTNVQAWDADLDTYAGITPSADVQTMLGSANNAAIRSNIGAGTGNGTVTSVSGTANRITSTGGATPVIDISATFEGLLGKVANRIDQNNAATTSTQFLSVISDESGTGNILTTNGSAASLTSFPTFNQNTTGTSSKFTGMTKAELNTANTDGDFVYTSDLGTNVGTFLATPSSANLRAALTDENGTGAALFSGATSPVFVTPDLGTPSALTLTNATGMTGLSKAITIVSPTSSENATLYYTTKAITVTQVRTVMLGSSQSITFTLNYGSDRSSATGTIVASNTFDSGDTGYQTTGFAATLNTTSIPAGSYIWITTSATSGTINDFNLTMTYTQ